MTSLVRVLPASRTCCVPSAAVNCFSSAARSSTSRSPGSCDHHEPIVVVLVLERTVALRQTVRDQVEAIRGGHSYLHRSTFEQT
ncbi:hypothetical protein B0H10DRAFT_1999872 [Mycena sp. CBHHK59/15]|nr:hypothetical protein B0H10DRAFT_1999872 [Mycena sp. CBHHK59/15]